MSLLDRVRGQINNKNIIGRDTVGGGGDDQSTQEILHRSSTAMTSDRVTALPGGHVNVAGYQPSVSRRVTTTTGATVSVSTLRRLLTDILQSLTLTSSSTGSRNTVATGNVKRSHLADSMSSAGSIYGQRIEEQQERSNRLLTSLPVKSENRLSAADVYERALEILLENRNIFAERQSPADWCDEDDDDVIKAATDPGAQSFVRRPAGRSRSPGSDVESILDAVRETTETYFGDVTLRRVFSLEAEALRAGENGDSESSKTDDADDAKHVNGDVIQSASEQPYKRNMSVEDGGNGVNFGNGSNGADSGQCWCSEDGNEKTWTLPLARKFRSKIGLKLNRVLAGLKNNRITADISKLCQQSHATETKSSSSGHATNDGRFPFLTVGHDHVLEERRQASSSSSSRSDRLIGETIRCKTDYVASGAGLLEVLAPGPTSDPHGLRVSPAFTESTIRTSAPDAMTSSISDAGDTFTYNEPFPVQVSERKLSSSPSWAPHSGCPDVSATFVSDRNVLDFLDEICYTSNEIIDNRFSNTLQIKDSGNGRVRSLCDFKTGSGSDLIDFRSDGEVIDTDDGIDDALPDSMLQLQDDHLPLSLLLRRRSKDSFRTLGAIGTSGGTSELTESARKASASEDNLCVKLRRSREDGSGNNVSEPDATSFNVLPNGAAAAAAGDAGAGCPPLTSAAMRTRAVDFWNGKRSSTGNASDVIVEAVRGSVDLQRLRLLRDCCAATASRTSSCEVVVDDGEITRERLREFFRFATVTGDGVRSRYSRSRRRQHQLAHGPAERNRGHARRNSSTSVGSGTSLDVSTRGNSDSEEQNCDETAYFRKNGCHFRSPSASSISATGSETESGMSDIAAGRGGDSSRGFFDGNDDDDDEGPEVAIPIEDRHILQFDSLLLDRLHQMQQQPVNLFDSNSFLTKEPVAESSHRHVAETFVVDNGDGLSARDGISMSDSYYSSNRSSSTSCSSEDDVDLDQQRLNERGAGDVINRRRRLRRANQKSDCESITTRDSSIDADLTAGGGWELSDDCEFSVTKYQLSSKGSSTTETTGNRLVTSSNSPDLSSLLPSEDRSKLCAVSPRSVRRGQSNEEVFPVSCSGLRTATTVEVLTAPITKTLPAEIHIARTSKIVK